MKGAAGGGTGGRKFSEWRIWGGAAGRLCCLRGGSGFGPDRTWGGMGWRSWDGFGGIGCHFGSTHATMTRKEGGFISFIF